MLNIKKLMKQKFKIFMNWTANAGTAYYRMINFAKFMRKQKNIDVAYSDFNQKRQTIADWELQLQEAKERGDINNVSAVTNDTDMLMGVSDISIWQMIHTAAGYALFRAYREKFKNKKPMLMEIDDYIFGVNPESLAYVNFHPNSDLETFGGWQIQNAHCVVVSTEYLKEKYKHLNPQIEVIPNGIDFDIWDKLKNKKERGRIRIGWSGGQAHREDLKVMSKVIPVILDKYKNVEFAFMGFMPHFIKTSSRVKHFNDWQGIFDYPLELSKLGFDIGVAPLRDNQFNRAKSNLRWLEYSALRIPTVASPVEPFEKSINHAGNGLFALETNEWIYQLSALIEDKALREGMGTQAYRTVKERYNAETISMKYLKLLKDLVRGRHGLNIKLFDEESKGKMFTVDV